MARRLVSDALRERLALLLPPNPQAQGWSAPYPGSGVSHWHHLRAPGRNSVGGAPSGAWLWQWDWHEAGVWERLHRVLLDELDRADQIERERAYLDRASTTAKKGDPGLNGTTALLLLLAIVSFAGG